jgi:Helicase conserved C-terminal domain
MLNQVILEITRKQRPYYYQFGKTIKGINNQFWLIFKHRDADNLITNIASFLRLTDKNTNYHVIRVDLNNALVYEYIPKKENNLPTSTVFRTSELNVIESFLLLENTSEEKLLYQGTFRELETQIKRRFNLPKESQEYTDFIGSYLERSKIYRRSTAYFNSGVLKLYEEPLFNLVLNEGKIKLLMDWQGFTNKRDIETLEKLHNLQFREQYIQQTLTDFLQGLTDKTFQSTTILAELVRLNILDLKMVKMDETKGIYHKKTGILTDIRGNSILHEGSDNFTLAAQTKNAESVTFLYYSDSLDIETIKTAISEFDSEWENHDFSYELNQPFLQAIIKEKQRRDELKKPQIESINPPELAAGKTTDVTITGKNLDSVETIDIPNNPWIDVNITQQSDTIIETQVIVAADHPSQPLTDLRVKEKSGTYHINKSPQIRVQKELVIPDFPEIKGFKEAVELILAGRHGTPDDFVFWLAQQKPHLLRVEDSDYLTDLVAENTLFEHQKSGAQHCYRIMQDFGVAVCADAVGLGKTRLAAAVARLEREQNGQAKIAIIAAKKLHDNWQREMTELGLKNGNHYELYNKNLMSRKNSNFLEDFKRYGGPDLIIIDEAHEGIRNYNSIIHKTCLKIRNDDIIKKRKRHYLLLTATPWNNRREDIYNILFPFLTRPEGFKDLGFKPEIIDWFRHRDVGLTNFIEETDIFRQIYRELFLQRTRKQLKTAMAGLNLYPSRQAEWLSVQFEPETEQALDTIFSQFEESLFIPFVDPIRYLKGSVTQRSLLRNQKRIFIQRAESSMYALRRTIKNFGARIQQLQQRLEAVTPDAEGLRKFLELHYNFISEQEFRGITDSNWEKDWDFDEDFEVEDEDDDTPETDKKSQRQKLQTAINIAIEPLETNSDLALSIYQQILEDCDSDLQLLNEIELLLANEFVKDHKREVVTNKVRELLLAGQKVLLISTFSDTVIDYYQYMTQDSIISSQGIGMAIGGNKNYHQGNKIVKFAPHNLVKKNRQIKGITRLELFRLFAPEASCKEVKERPNSDSQINVLIGSETLSVGQNLQDADYLINIDLPWNPMVLEQRIGRIDRPKTHPCDYIYIYYANSESQLLRQASRLDNLHKKLIGDSPETGFVPTIEKMTDLGASIYGDTAFDDEVLPGYIDFIRSLIKARNLEQHSVQEMEYEKQEAVNNLYTENEILQSQELSRLIKRLGADYLPNSISIGQGNNNQNSPQTLVGLTINYYGPNNEFLADKKETLFWNNLTGEKDGYGQAISTGFKTPEYIGVVSTSQTLEKAQLLYNQLLKIKQEYEQKIVVIDEFSEHLTVTSERVNRIQKRIRTMEIFPDGIDRKVIKTTLNQLNQHKEKKPVQDLLKNYTDGEKSRLPDGNFILALITELEDMALLNFETIKQSKMTVSLDALLMVF